MSLREIGHWFLGAIHQFVDAIALAFHTSYLDWPLWLSVPLPIIALSLIGWYVRVLSDDFRSGDKLSFFAVAAYSAMTVACAAVTFDLFVSMAIFEEEDPSLKFMRVCYPLMTFFFGTYAVVQIAKWLR
ncbi:MAG: hypothetical protein HOY44_10060 [Maritimibacter sp.]|uniref:hypothetical protein n=1 Tax=Maritimibacter sp. TaxID=2003363 RepID=UPI001DC4E62D|nr:hypothetical protein [Maritimibacter sp.]MBL6427857.1 hypothetical protein [Maritimibacter sp.]